MDRSSEPSSSSPRHGDTLADQVTTSTSSMNSFTFVLNNSQQSSTPTFDTAVNPDRFAHTRTKRKRTSPEDFAILERAYEREPRPDRNSRTEIASQVALNEKEVQIWFQNRRQMTRRKARTWQPNEISDIIHSSQQTGSASPPASQDMSSQDLASSQSSAGDKAEEQTSNLSGIGQFEHTNVASFQEQAREEGVVVHVEDEAQPNAPAPMSTSEGSKDTAQGEQLLVDEASSVAKSDTQTGTIPDKSTPDLSTAAVKSPRALKRTRSNMRMRMSLEGKAELVFDKTTPSPPSKDNRRESWPARGSLRRSQSAMTPSTPSLEQTATDVPSSSQPLSQPWNRPRALGHSRDARTWQFYCEPEAPDALAIAAEHDRKGNAQGALRMLRSTSGTAKKLPGSPLMPSLRKQNSNVKRSIEAAPKPSSKRKSLDELDSERPKLARTSSSVARLQTAAGKPLHSPIPSLPKTASKKSKSKKGSSLEVWEDADDDSDKENWQPGTRVSAPTHPARQHPVASRREVLGANLTELSHESSLGALMDRKNAGNARRRQKSSQVDHEKLSTRSGSDGDHEVAAFMGEGAGVDAQREDMSAVEGLLSLSKGGHW